MNRRIGTTFLRNCNVDPRRIQRLLDLAARILAGRSPAHIQEILRDGQPYLRRHFIAERGHSPQVWLHQMLVSDGECLHDHPWDYSSLLVHGSYVEETSDGMRRTYREGDVVQRKAEHLHRLVLDAPAATLFVAHRPRRDWGFATPSGWVPASTYLGLP